MALLEKQWCLLAERVTGVSGMTLASLAHAMDPSEAVIFDHSRSEMLRHFELDADLFAELKQRKVFPDSYLEYLEVCTLLPARH